MELELSKPEACTLLRALGAFHRGIALADEFDSKAQALTPHAEADGMAVDAGGMAAGAMPGPMSGLAPQPLPSGGRPGQASSLGQGMYSGGGLGGAGAAGDDDGASPTAAAAIVCHGATGAAWPAQPCQ